MIVRAKTGNENIATVYIMDFGNDRLAEAVESVQPPIPRAKKWVLIISTLFGCPVGCRMCDAGGEYRGKIAYDGLIAQIDFLIRNRYPDGNVPAEKFKIQFARMGEPAFNPDVLRVLKSLPKMYRAKGLLPAISTIAPAGCGEFFDELCDIKNEKYANGKFQMQFSIHSTDQKIRNWLIPTRIWTLSQIARYGEKFFRKEDRKITLNFALGKDIPLEPDILLANFDPDIFFIKITPINPTIMSVKNNLASERSVQDIITKLERAGYDVLLSIGELEENDIGSNCGQYISRFRRQNKIIQNAYKYQLKEVCTVPG